MSTCAHTICRTTEPCRYGMPGTTDAEARAAYATRPAWTLVARRKGARFYRPVGNVPAGLDWHGARDAAELVPYADDVHVWYVPRETTHEEDRDNVLEDNGKRFPIRWDAAPQVSIPITETREADTMATSTITYRGYRIVPVDTPNGERFRVIDNDGNRLDTTTEQRDAMLTVDALVDATDTDN